MVGLCRPHPGDVDGDQSAGLRRGPAHGDTRATPWRSRPVLVLVLCGLVLAGVIAAATAIMLSQLRDRALDDRKRELQNLALTLAEHTDRSFQAVELVQESLINRMQTLGIATGEQYEQQMSGQDTHLMLKDKISGLPYVDAMTLFNSDGVLINSSRAGPIPAINIAERDHFKLLKGNADLALFVSRPVRSAITGDWNIYIGHRISGPNGEFLGVVLGAIQLQYFQQFFSAIALWEGSSISLLRNDGVLLVRHPDIGGVIGHSYGAAISALGHADRGTIRIIGKMDGKDRILAGQRLAHYPIVVSVGIDSAAVLANWQSGALYIASAAVLIVLIICGVILLSAKQVQRKLRTENARFDAALNNMSQGLAMFDRERRLIVCNKRFAEVYSLPDHVLLPGTTQRQIVKHGTPLRDYSGAEAKRHFERQADAASRGQATSSVLELIDGRFVFVSHQPMEDGGWVSTHEDITDRKRIEEELRTQYLRFDTALNNMSHGLCMFDSAARLIVCNDRYRDMYGVSPDLVKPGIALEDLLEYRRQAGTYSGNVQRYIADLLAALAEGQAVKLTVETGDGRSIAIVNQPMAGGGWVATHEDITDRVQAERERDRSRTFLDTVIENIPVSVYVKEAHDLRYILLNRSAEKLWGVSREDTIGKTAHELFAKARADRIAAHDRQVLESAKRELFIDAHQIDPTQSGSPLITSRRVGIAGEDGKPKYIVGVIEDVTDRARAEQRIAQLAHYDTVTGLANRVSLREQLDATFARVRRGERVALHYIDLDHFKNVNDTLGHPMGDALLRSVAERLRACVRDVDTLARLSGDEFAVIQASIAGPDDATALAKRIYEAIRAPHDIQGHHVSVDASIGIAVAPEDADSPDQLLKNADMALYEAKTIGRSTFCFFEQDLERRMRAKRELERELRQALAGGQLELFYQPLVNLQTDEIAGCEALMRWRHPERGMIPPADFIPIAEDLGLIKQLGEWALRTACAEAATWPDGIKVAVNLSPAQLAGENLVQAVVNALAAAGLPAHRLEPEITETVLMSNTFATLTTLHQLRKLGVRIALDDFGTGYSALSYLRCFPFDKIKIDRSFISNLVEEDNSRAIVQAVVNLARDLNMTTTAEGIETEEQMCTVRDLGCREMQGYFFSRPQPAADIARMLAPRAVRAAGVA